MLPLLFVSVWMLTTAVLLGYSRYHVPLAPAYALLAAPALAMPWQALRGWSAALRRARAA